PPSPWMSRFEAPSAIWVDWVGYEPVRTTISSPLAGMLPAIPSIAVFRSQGVTGLAPHVRLLTPVGPAYRSAEACDGTASVAMASAAAAIAGRLFLDPDLIRSPSLSTGLPARPSLRLRLRHERSDLGLRDARIPAWRRRRAIRPRESQPPSSTGSSRGRSRSSRPGGTSWRSRFARTA